MSTPTVRGITFLEHIGEGGIADVWSARWDDAVQPDQIYAVKVLRDPSRPNLRRRFLREGRILQHQRHPGLVRCHAVLDGPEPALVLDRLYGESLDRTLARGPLPVGEVYALARSVLEILVHLHDQGVVHRDLKASNIWRLDGDGGPGGAVLMDLGLAIDPTDPLTSTLGQVVGTHAYMAPEQIAGSRVDTRADLYALGITLYEALCGQRPYQARGLAGYLQAHQSGRAAPIGERVPDLDPAFAALVDRLMARDPADRPQSAAIALALLALGSPLQREASPDAGEQGWAPIRTLTSPRAPVGREAVRGAVLACLHGRGQPGTVGVLQLHGELGSGLGAAAEQARELAKAEGIEHVSLRAHHGASVPWALRTLAGCLDGWAGSVKPTAAGVRNALAGLAGESRSGPGLLLVVEDVSDDGLVGWIGEVRAAIPELVVVTTGQSPRRGLGGLHVALRPLTEEETGDLIRRMLGARAAPLALTATVFEATGGQPALVVVAMRRLAGAGALVCTGADDDGSPTWRWIDTIRPTTPARATRDLQRTLAQLPPASRTLLDAIADNVDPSDLERLEAALGLDADAVYPLLRLGLVHVDEDDRVRLRRPILADVIRGGRPPTSGGAARIDVDGDPAADALLAETEGLLSLGRPVAPRLIDAVRDLGDAHTAHRSWLLANVALRHADANTARRRLLRVTGLDPEIQTRVGAEATLALIDLELRIGRRSDAAARTRLIVANSAVDAHVRGRLQLLLARQHASQLELHAATVAHAEAVETLSGTSGTALAPLTWIDILLRAGALDEAEDRIAALAHAADDGCEWSVRAWYATLVARLRALKSDPAAAHAAHVRAMEWSARAADEPRHAYHAGMAAVLCGNVRAGTEHAAQLESPAFADLRAELLSACARRARDARLYQLAEASARACGDRSLLLALLHSLRGPGARAEAHAIADTALVGTYSPLRAHFLDMPAVTWARSLAG